MNEFFNNATRDSIKGAPITTNNNGCLEMTFKKDYQVTFFSDEKSLKGNWLKGDLIRGTVHRNGEFVTIKTSTKGTCSLDTADSYLVGIFGDEAEMKDLLEIKDTTQTSTMQHIPSVPLRNIKGLSGDANTTENPLVDLVAGSGFGKFMSGQKRMMTFASVGSLYGFYRAYQGNKKIGGYIGNALLFSLIGYAVGYLSLKVVPPKSNFVVTQGGTNSFSNAVSNQGLSAATKCNCKSKMYVVENIGGTMYYVKYYLLKGRYFYQTNPDGTINYATRMCYPEKICGEPILIKLDPPIPAPTGRIIATNP